MACGLRQWRWPGPAPGGRLYPRYFRACARMIFENTLNLNFRHSMRKVPTVRPAVQAQSSYFTLNYDEKKYRYAPREEKTWPAHISCLPPSPSARVANNLHEIWTVQVFSSIGAYIL